MAKTYEFGPRFNIDGFIPQQPERISRPKREKEIAEPFVEPHALELVHEQCTCWERTTRIGPSLDRKGDVRWNQPQQRVEARSRRTNHDR